jgi:predicted RNA polymerase sigma factor
VLAGVAVALLACWPAGSRWWPRAAGLAALAGLDDRLTGHHRLDAVRAHLLEMAGDAGRAVTHYLRAAGRTTSLAERDYLTAKAARLRRR